MCRSLKSELLRARLGFRIGHAGENHEDADIQGKSDVLVAMLIVVISLTTAWRGLS